MTQPVHEAQLVSEAKGYNPNAAEAKRQVDSYFENFRDRDTPANRGIVLRMSDPAIQADMQQLFDQADGKVMNMDAMPDAAVRPTAAEKGGGQVPEPTPVVQPNPLRASGRDPYTGATSQGQYADTKQAQGARVSEAAAKEAPSQVPVAPPAAAGQLPVELPPQGPGYSTVSPGTAMLSSSQSTSQGIQDTPEMKARRDYIEQQEHQSAEDMAFHASLQGQEMLRLSNERQKKLIEMAKADENFQRRQARVNAETEGRIRSAEQALKEAEVDPNFNPMREIMEGDDWGKKIMMGMGALFGGIGSSAQTNATGIYHPNMFFEQFQKSVDRKMDLFEKRYRSRKDQLGAAQDGYARMRQILQDEQATRAMIEARAWQMFDLEVDKVAQQYGLDTNDARVAQLHAGIAERANKREMEVAKTVGIAAGQQEAFRPITIIPGGESKLPDEIQKYDEEKFKRGITAREDIMDLVNDGIPANIKGSTWNQDWAQYIYSGNPGILSTRLAQWVAEDPRALESVAAAMNTYGHELFGANLTENEIRQRVKTATGSAESLVHFLRRLQNEHRTQLSSLDAAMPQAAAVHKQRREQILQSPGATYQPRPVREDKPGAK